MSGKKHKEIRKQNKALRRDENEIARKVVINFMHKTLHSPLRVRSMIAWKILRGAKKNGNRKA